MDHSMQNSWNYLTVFGTPDREASADSDLFFKLPIGSLSKSFQLKYAYDVMS